MARLPMTCPTCRAVRAPNARFCHACGHDYEALLAGAAQSATASRVEHAAGTHTVRHVIGFGEAFKIGLGLAAGALVVGLLATVGWIALLAAIIDAALRPFR